MNLLQWNIVADDEKNQRLSKVKYLRRIQNLKETHKIPKLIIKSIINDSQRDFIIVNESLDKQYVLESGYEYEVDKDDIPFLMLQNQRKISLDEQLQGVCSQFKFFIVELDEFGCVSIKNCALCSVDLIVELDEKEDEIALNQIDKVFIVFLA